jgi:uncharacterized phiE125 gp8 family phage protein
MALILITDAASEPITLADARLHLRLASDYTTEDAIISALVKAARRMAEQELGRALITQTWEVVLDAFPADEIELPKPSVQAITSVKYIDTSSVEQTLSSATYSLDTSTLPGWLKPAYGTDWPSDVLDSTNVVRVRFTAGYGSSASDVPPEIVAWMKVQLATLWRNREAFMAGVSVTELPGRYIDSLLDRERWYG